ncbi:MAG: hypothetical protein F6K26_31930 [Moorea sp. SIO2I5]|nr:hypothetical protein [Moorena sp. SIO2I5]
MQRGLGEAARSWGFPRGKQRCGRRFRTQPLPMSDCRGFPHERLHQDNVLTFMGSAISSPERLSIKF